MFVLHIKHGACYKVKYHKLTVIKYHFICKLICFIFCVKSKLNSLKKCFDIYTYVYADVVSLLIFFFFFFSFTINMKENIFFNS